MWVCVPSVCVCVYDEFNEPRELLRISNSWKMLPKRATQIQTNTRTSHSNHTDTEYRCPGGSRTNTNICLYICMYDHRLSVYKYVCCRWWKKEESQEKNTTEKRRQKCSQAFATSFVSCCGSGGGIVFRRWGNTLRENAHCPFAMVIPVSNLQPWQFDATS